MNIEEFKDVRVFLETDNTETQKYHELDYCIPLCDTDGFFIELGVYKGNTLKHMSKNNPKITFHGFDTFEGIDEWWDLGGKRKNMKTFATEIPTFESNVQIHKGLFQDTLPVFKDNILKNNKLSFVNIDCDVYSSTIFSLNLLNDNIKPGTILRFDEIADWNVLKFRKGAELDKPTFSPYTKWREHEYKALCEWTTKYNRKVKALWRNWHVAGGMEVIQ